MGIHSLPFRTAVFASAQAPHSTSDKLTEKMLDAALGCELTEHSSPLALASAIAIPWTDLDELGTTKTFEYTAETAAGRSSL